MLKKLSLTLVVIMAVSAIIAAIHRSTEAQSGCSAQEQQMLQRAVQLATNGYIQEYINVLAQIESALSPECKRALQQAQQYAPYQGSGGGVGNVYDHGGGTYSVPGGNCGPDGCAVY